MSAMLPFAYSIVLFLSGAVCGFFVWAWYRNSDDAMQAEFRRHSQKFRDSVKREQDHSATLQTELTQRIMQLRSVDELNHQLESKLKRTQSLYLNRDSEMKTATKRADVTLKLLEEQQTARIGLRHELDLARQHLTEMGATIEQQRQEIESTRNTEPVETAVAEEVSVKPATDQPVILKVVFDDSREESQDVAGDEIAQAANCYVDPVLGKLFRSRPADVDDLKQIAGIAETLEQKLHEQGIYTFEQIMLWDEQAIVAFSGLLKTFQDRVERNNWVAQAQYLYDQKLAASQQQSPAA